MKLRSMGGLQPGPGHLGLKDKLLKFTNFARPQNGAYAFVWLIVLSALTPLFDSSSSMGSLQNRPSHLGQTNKLLKFTNSARAQNSAYASVWLIVLPVLLQILDSATSMGSLQPGPGHLGLKINC